MLVIAEDYEGVHHGAPEALVRRCAFLPKPLASHGVEAFVANVAGFRWGVMPEAMPAFDAFRETHGLSIKQAEIVASVLHDDAPRDGAARLGIQVSTYRTRLGQICKKVGAATPDVLRREIGATGAAKAPRNGQVAASRPRQTR